MLKQAKWLRVATGGLIAAALLATTATTSLYAGDDEAAVIKEGKELAFGRKKGNCLACHMIADGTLPGNIGPPLIVMKARYPDFDKLVTQISNPLLTNPNSMMPPFGLHGILSDDEIEKIAKYIHTL